MNARWTPAEDEGHVAQNRGPLPSCNNPSPSEKEAAGRMGLSNGEFARGKASAVRRGLISGRSPEPIITRN